MADLKAAELASQYGWSLALLKSDKSLWALFQKAVKNSYTAEKFTAELRNTAFYKKNSESVRQYTVLKTTDPATFNARKAALIAQIRDASAAMGATIPSSKLATIADSALKFSWNDAQLKDTLGSYVRAVNGVYTGAAATDTEQLKQTAWRNGVSLSAPTIQNWAALIAKGQGSVQMYQTQIRNLAKGLAPGYQQELDAGMDLFDVANPFIQSKAKILETNPADIDLFDPDVRKAMSGTTKDGKPASTSLWQFEQSLRQDRRWLGTQNAQDSLMNVGHQVLRDMGLMGN